MLMEEVMAWNHWRIRLQAQEALMAVQIAHGDPREVANTLTATSVGITKEDYEQRRAQAMAVASTFKALTQKGKK